MDRIFSLVILLLAHGYSNASSSTVIYPTFGGLSKTVVNGQPSYGAKTGARALSNGTIRFPIGGKLFAGLNPSQAEGIGNAITAKGIVNQFSAKKILVRAVAGGLAGVALTWLAGQGIEYIAGQFQQPASPVTLGAVQGYVDSSGNFHFELNGTSLYCPATIFEGTQTFSVAQYLGYEGLQCFYSGGNRIPPRIDSVPYVPSSQPISQADAEAVASASSNTLSQSEIQALIDAGWVLPLDTTPNTVIGDFTDLTAEELADLQGMGFFQPMPGVGALPVGDPVTDPVTGQKTQPYVQLDPAPNAGVRVTPYEAPLNPDGTPATDPQGNPLPNQERNPDPCELDPERAGCSKLGDLDDEPPVPTQLNVSLNPMDGWDAPGSCPADVVIDAMGQQIPFKFKGACDFFTMMRPVILAGAWIVATLIFVGGVRT